MDKIKKHITLSKENVMKVDELSQKGKVSKSVVINEVLNTYFKQHKKINVGINL